MKNLYFLKLHTLIMDTIYTNEWVATMMQLMKHAGNDLYEHSIHVALLSAIIALSDNQKLLSKADIPIQSLILGALLHDIGYMGIPRSIDRTAARREYSPMEKMAFDMHISIGSEQLRIHTKDSIILDISSMHHEYLDGSGVPLGLKSNAIPLHVRIVSLANLLINDSCIFAPSGSESIMTNQELCQKYDVSILRSFFAESRLYFESLSSIYNDFHNYPFFNDL